MDIKKLISEMTIEEKASFCSGLDGWHTEGLERLGIPNIMMADGPHGLRKVVNKPGTKTTETVPATCYASAAGLACSWNEELLYNVGTALASEAKAEQVSILLGPGINMKRSPVCGRNFEYFSEDPYLAGKLSAAYIKGVQENGVATCIKQFAVNNQETRRHSTSANVDMRTLREIYLAAFEIAIKESKPATIMHSYNCINGTQASDSKWLLNDILREEWGYEGFVMSDWNGMNNRVVSLEAGCELEMPASGGVRDKLIVDAVNNGTLDEAILDRAVERILNIVYSYLPDENAPKADLNENHGLAAKLSEECMVLLKNENNVLPLEAGKPLAVIGAFAKNPRYQGGGSSHVNTAILDDIFDYIKERNNSETVYAAGYNLDTTKKRTGTTYKDYFDADFVDTNLITEAVEAAKKCGRAVIFAGMPDSFESEGYDRTHMRMPESHNKLIEAVASAVPDTIVILLAGSPVEMPWLNKVPALFHAYLGGCALGGAITRLIYGDVNPSGKLAETHPLRYEDTPAYLNFPGDGNVCNYAEGVYIGYRYYQKRNMEVNFPFGFGLSYTTFSYDKIESDGDKIKVSVTNTGKRAGKESVQLYIGADSPSISRPVKELKSFKKVYLEPGESTVVEFELDDRSFAYYDVRVKDWRVETGSYTVFAGRNSADTPLTLKIDKVDKKPYLEPLNRNSTVLDIITNEGYAPARDKLMSQLFEGYISEEDIQKHGFTLNIPLINSRRYHTLRMFIRYNNRKMNETDLACCIDEANRKLGF